MSIILVALGIFLPSVRVTKSNEEKSNHTNIDEKIYNSTLKQESI